MDKFCLPSAWILLIWALATLILNPSDYAIWATAFATLVWAVCMGMTVKSGNHDYEQFMEDHSNWRTAQKQLNENAHDIHKNQNDRIRCQEEVSKDLAKQLDSVRAAINMKQLGR